MLATPYGEAGRDAALRSPGQIAAPMGDSNGHGAVVNGSRHRMQERGPALWM